MCSQLNANELQLVASECDWHTVGFQDVDADSLVVWPLAVGFCRACVLIFPLLCAWSPAIVVYMYVFLCVRVLRARSCGKWPIVPTMLAETRHIQTYLPRRRVKVEIYLCNTGDCQ